MKNEDKQDIECTLFPKAFNTTTYVPTTLGLYIDSVIGGRYKKEVENVRAYVAAGDKEHAAACKKNLPLLVPGGRMEGGRKLEHLVGYSACVVTDLDHVAGSPRELLARAKELAYVKAGHISPSGTGLKLFVLVDSDKAHHLQAFQVVSRRVEADLPGVKVDPSGKDANRGCFVSYDPEAFYKVESVVVNIPVDPGKAASFAEPGAASLSNYIDKYEIGNVFVGGGRHSYVVKLASALNNAGFYNIAFCDQNGNPVSGNENATVTGVSPTGKQSTDNTITLTVSISGSGSGSGSGTSTGDDSGTTN